MRYLAVLGASLLTLSLPVTSCELMGVRGLGDVISETRRVDGFTTIALRGSGRVSVEVTGEESLTIAAEENLMPLLTSEVKDGVLELGSSESISPTEEIVYTITVASLEGVSVGGSGRLTAGEVSASTFEATVSGSGEVVLSGLAVDQLMVRISGSGVVELSGSANQLDLEVSGSGSYLGEDLVSMTAQVTVSRSGDAMVHVTEDLVAAVSDSGSIHYRGGPASVDSSISGSGIIEED